MDETLKHLLSLGRSYFARRDFLMAEKFLAQVVEKHRGFADVFNMLGVIYHDQSQFDRAQRSFEAALEINPGYSEAALNLAVIYNEAGRYEDARRIYREAMAASREGDVRVDPVVRGKIANMYADIGEVYLSVGMAQDAITAFQQALNLAGDFVDIRMKLATALRERGESEQSVRELERVVELRPGYAAGQVALGVSLYAAGRHDEALGRWRQVLAELDPEHRAAKMYLALAGAESTEREQR